MRDLGGGNPHKSKLFCPKHLCAGARAVGSNQHQQVLGLVPEQFSLELMIVKVSDETQE